MDKKRKADLTLIIILLLIAAVLFAVYGLFYPEDGDTVIVEVDGTMINSLPLAEDAIITVDGITGGNEFEIKDGHVSMISAECPDKICVQHRAISKNGESIICLPNRVVIRITGGEEAEVDAIAN